MKFRPRKAALLKPLLVGMGSFRGDHLTLGAQLNAADGSFEDAGPDPANLRVDHGSIYDDRAVDGCGM